VHPGGSGGSGGGSACGRVHSRHSSPHSLRCTSSRASGEARVRIQAVQTALQVALRAAQLWRWTSSSHRAVVGDALRARCSLALSASRCCFFDSFFARPLSTVSIGGCALLSCVVSLLFSGLYCGFPAVLGESLRGARMMVPSRRQVTVTPSLRARRAAWRRS